MLESDPPRTIKPRKTNYKHYDIFALCGNQVLDENGNIGTVPAFIDSLPSRRPLIVVRRSVADFIAKLDTRFESDKDWQWRLSNHERDIYLPNGRTKAASRISCVIHFWGWKNSAFHLALDPTTFYGKSIDEIWPGNDPVINRLLAWATTLREWCHENNLCIRPTNGGISSQFLRNPRFYPDTRRKVPAAINARTRERLPGNHYQLYGIAASDKYYRANYLDQKRAHHYHARTTHLPNSDTCYAYGRFLDLAHPTFSDTFDGFYGLYYLRLRCPSSISAFLPRNFHGKGSATLDTFVYSNELQVLKDFGYKVEGVIAAWGSRHRDTGLPAFATWSEDQLDKHSDPAWLKPILLSTYGILATKPRAMQFIFKHAKNGTPCTVMTGHLRINGTLVTCRNGQKVEPGIVHVLQRGMIEAATRAESLGLAHWLTQCHSQNVLAIYADGVIVEQDDDNPLPASIPEPWRNKTELNHLRFVNKQAFISGEMTKLPGIIGREIQPYSNGGFGKAPNVPMYDAITGQRVRTEKKIYGNVR